MTTMLVASAPAGSGGGRRALTAACSLRPA